MKRFTYALVAIATLSACCSTTNDDITIDEQNHQNEAYNLSYELASKVAEATSHEEFMQARQELEAYREAFRTQIGGESYNIFLEECNIILEEM